MIRPLRAALLIGAALSLPAEATLSASRPLCRVEASYTPVSWPEWTPLKQRFRRIAVELRPGCPAGGVARVHLSHTSGRRLPASGHYTLSAARPRLNIPNSPPYALTTPGWTVYWHGASRNWPVFQRLNLAPRGGDAQ